MKRAALILGLAGVLVAAGPALGAGKLACYQSPGTCWGVLDAQPGTSVRARATRRFVGDYSAQASQPGPAQLFAADPCTERVRLVEPRFVLTLECTLRRPWVKLRATTNHSVRVVASFAGAFD